MCKPESTAFLGYRRRDDRYDRGQLPTTRIPLPLELQVDLRRGSRRARQRLLQFEVFFCRLHLHNCVAELQRPRVGIMRKCNRFRLYHAVEELP